MGNAWREKLAAAKNDRGTLASLLEDVAPALRRFVDSFIETQWQHLIATDDVLQESFVDVILSIDSFEGGSQKDLENWIKRIAKNNYLDAIRGLTSQKRSEQRRLSSNDGRHGVDSAYELLSAVSPGDSPSGETSKKECLEKLSAAIRRLPQADAEVIVLYDIENFSIQQISQQLNISCGTAFMRRNRALKMLRGFLGNSEDI